MKKSSSLYILILCVWAAVSALLVVWLVWQCRAAGSFPVGFFLTLSVLSLVIFWLGSVKNLLFSFCYAVKKPAFTAAYLPILDTRPVSGTRVLLLYCTADDFSSAALSASMRQSWPWCRTVILDDSRKAASRAEIDGFARQYGCEVIRRADRRGYKAGNLNHFLCGRTDYDCFVVLDSDEVIPPDYVEQTLRFFAHDPKVGAVQARHVAEKGKNAFQSLLGMSVRSNGVSAQTVKNFYGANALLGHGMTISRACYEATGGFPHVVAEDISFAVLIKNAGFETVYAPFVVCREEFPADYPSLKKRQCKWTQGNLEYMRKYHREIVRSRMAWYEKLDLILSHYLLPVTPMLSLVLVLCSIFLGLFDYEVVRHSLFIYGLMTLFLLSPLLPDLFAYGKNRRAAPLLLPYFVLNIITYASLAPMMIRTVIAGLCGRKAKFLVTPKGHRRFTFYEILSATMDSLLFAFAVAVFTYWSCGTVLPAILPVASCALAPTAVWLANFQLKEPQTRRRRRRAS